MLNYDGRLDEEKGVAFKDYDVNMISKEFVEAIEEACGRGSQGWGDIDPREIISEVLKIAHKYTKGV